MGPMCQALFPGGPWREEGRGCDMSVQALSPGVMSNEAELQETKWPSPQPPSICWWWGVGRLQKEQA
jgi:hypothetical protein